MLGHFRKLMVKMLLLLLLLM